MKRRERLRYAMAWALVTAVIGLVGCVENVSYRLAPGSGNTPGPAQQAWLKGDHESEVFVVEFDDQGELWPTGERQFVLSRIEDLVRDMAQGGPPLTVLVFVHGWHHNAKAGDANLESFRSVLGKLAGSPAFSARRWLGVFIGWRGEAVSLPPLNFLTYWNRRNAAARVGGIPFAHFLADLATRVQSNDENMMLVIGHSFGARVVETSVTNVLGFYTGMTEGGSKPKPLLDLVVLLDEASEALRAKAMIDTFRHEGAWPGAPQLVSITSTQDTATGFAFPLGQGFLALRERFRDYRNEGRPEEQALPNQEELFTHTAGWTPALWSHCVTVAPAGYQEANQPPDVVPFSISGLEPGATPDYLLVPIQNTACAGKGGSFNSGTPYWILQVPDEIILNHNDIFNEHLQGLLGGIVFKYFGSSEVIKSNKIKRMQPSR